MNGEALTAPGAASFLVDVSALVRTFGSRRALDGVSFQLGAGDSLALFGPNGAGKTTLLRVLAGLLKPTSGTARVAGLDTAAGPEARAVVGFISHHSMLYSALTSHENVAFAATLQGVPNPADAALRALSRLGVGDRADTPVRLLSRGLQQRVSIARAIVHEPRLLLADEPYSGLDAGGAAALTDALTSLRSSGAALVLVTHNVAEGLAVATHAGVLAGGKCVRYEPTARLDAAAFTEEYRRTMGRDAA